MKPLKKLSSLALLCSILILIMSGCGKSKAVTLGEMEDSKYNNDYFGFSLTIPEFWDNVYSSEDIEALTKGFNKLDMDSTEAIDLGELDHLMLVFATNSTTANPSLLEISAFKIGFNASVWGKITTAHQILTDLLDESTDEGYDGKIEN